MSAVINVGKSFIYRVLPLQHVVVSSNCPRKKEKTNCSYKPKASINAWWEGYIQLHSCPQNATWITMEYVRTVPSTKNGSNDLICLLSFGQFQQLQVTNHSTAHVRPLSHASNAPQQGKHSNREQHSRAFPMIDIMIDWAVICQKKVPHRLPLFSYYCLQPNILRSVTIRRFWLIT